MGGERSPDSELGVQARPKRRIARETRYRLGMAQEAGVAQEAEARGHATARLADFSEGAMRDLAVLPLRMLAGALGIFEALLRTAADAVSERDPADERVVDLERRVDSLEEQVTGGQAGQGATSPRTKSAPTG